MAVITPFVCPRTGSAAMTSTSKTRREPGVGVGAVLVRSDGAVLIGHRIKRGEIASWCLPGGHVEEGESFEAAAVREIAEESGIQQVTQARVFAVALHTGADRTQVTAGVVARSPDAAAVAATPEPQVFDRWVWARPEELPVPLFPGSAALLAAWQAKPVPDGWTVYPTADAMALRGDGR
jgi:8-oxo-dGTP diphosphatase